MTSADNVKAAFFEGYRAMRGQFNLEDFVEEAWEASESKRVLNDEPLTQATVQRLTARAQLRVLADTMRKGFHGNLVDVPVSPRLDEWIAELDRIIAALRTP